MPHAPTLPWTSYIDPAVYADEQVAVFHAHWQYAGHRGQLGRPGDFFTCRAGDVPLVLVHDEAGRLRAFVNVCRHRGSLLVEGAGNRRTLQCRYHAWTYRLDGSLLAAPRSEREPGFQLEGISLREVALDSWGPFLFVNPDLDAAPLASALGELPRIIAEGGIDVDALEFRLRSEYELAANWKIACENYLECYHCSVAHPDFSALVNVDPDDYVLEASGLLLSQYARPREQPRRSPYDARGAVERGQFHLLWPNVKVNILPGRPNLSIGPVLPDGPGRSEGFLDYFFLPGEDEAWVGDLLAFDERVGAEDRALVESVQRGVGSGVIEHGVLLASSEQLIERFQALVREALGQP